MCFNEVTLRHSNDFSHTLNSHSDIDMECGEEQRACIVHVNPVPF